MTRIERIEEKQSALEQEIYEKKTKKFKLPFGIKQLMKKAVKDPSSILVEYLTQTGEIKFKLCKIISGDVIMINNKAHKFNPKCLWRFKKYPVYVYREISRDAVSNLDYDDVKEKGKDTDSDVVLIKAVLGAVQKKASPIQGKGVWIIIGLVVIVILLYFFTR